MYVAHYLLNDLLPYLLTYLPTYLLACLLSRCQEPSVTGRTRHPPNARAIHQTQFILRDWSRPRCIRSSNMKASRNPVSLALHMCIKK